MVLFIIVVEKKLCQYSENCIFVNVKQPCLLLSLTLMRYSLFSRLD